jgi:hypothetical protein
VSPEASSETRSSYNLQVYLHCLCKDGEGHIRTFELAITRLCAMLFSRLH